MENEIVQKETKNALSCIMSITKNKKGFQPAVFNQKKETSRIPQQPTDQPSENSQMLPGENTYIKHAMEDYLGDEKTFIKQTQRKRDLKAFNKDENSRIGDFQSPTQNEPLSNLS